MKTYVQFQHVYFGNRNFSWSGRVFVVHSYHGRKQRVQFSFFLFTELTNQDVTKYSGQFLYAFVPKKWTTIVTNISLLLKEANSEFEWKNFSWGNVIFVQRTTFGIRIKFKIDTSEKSLQRGTLNEPNNQIPSYSGFTQSWKVIEF